MEYHRLHQALEVLANQAVAILHHICSPDGGDSEPVKVRPLQPNSKEVLLHCRPVMVKFVPCIFRMAEQDCVKDFYESVLGRIKDWQKVNARDDDSVK
jgi:hypothetical protein